MKKEYFSAKNEPAFGDGDFERDPAEERVADLDGEQGELESVRDSVLNEPAFTGVGGQYHLREWLEKKREQYGEWGNLWFSVAAAVVAGPFAVLGAFMSNGGGWGGVVYCLVFGPVAEEILKQSGMIYLLEKKPYRVFSGWQIVLSGVVTALIFATLENLLYLNVYIPQSNMANPELYTFFRWTVCTALHVCCSAIAALGLVRVWKRQMKDGRAADISYAFEFFVLAMVVHGLYNLGALYFDKFFIVK